MKQPSGSAGLRIGIVALALVAALALALLVVVLGSGFGNSLAPESAYGSSLDSSVNGTAALAALCAGRVTRSARPAA